MRKRSQRGPLASRRAAAALAPATERQDSAQAALHAKHDANYLRRESRLSGAPRAPVVVPEGSMPGRPGFDIIRLFLSIIIESS